MKGVKKCFGPLLALFTIFGLSLSVSLNANALSPSYTEPNYIWRTPNSSSNWFLQNQGRVTLKNYLYSGIGRQFIGRYQFSFPTSIYNLSENTVLSVEIQLKSNDYSGNNPGVTLPYTGWGQGTDVRINISNQKSGYCYVKDKSSDIITFFCEYVFENVNSINQLWVDLGNLSVENGNSPAGNSYLYVGSTFWIEYINYSYTTGLSPSSQAIINAINNSNSQIINQNQQIINQNNEAAEKDQQDRDNINQASNDANNSSSSSQQQAEQTGTTLLKAFTDFVGALTNAQPSNCNLDMDLGNLDLGIVNLCSLSPPPVFQTIASIFMILFCVPLSIATARKVISLFRSFQ